MKSVQTAALQNETGQNPLTCLFVLWAGYLWSSINNDAVKVLIALRSRNMKHYEAPNLTLVGVHLL